MGFLARSFLLLGWRPSLTRVEAIALGFIFFHGISAHLFSFILLRLEAHALQSILHVLLRGRVLANIALLDVVADLPAWLCFFSAWCKRGFLTLQLDLLEGRGFQIG